MKTIILVIAGLLVLAGVTSVSFPRLAVEQASGCGTCHTNPNGGGMRNEFGSYTVALNELTLQSTKKLIIDKVRKPRISEAVLVGFDTRHLVFDDGRIFRMQTDVFVDFEPIKDFHYFFRFWESGIFENYGLLFLDNKKYYVKLGRFFPVFGLRNEDHTAFNRVRTGHGPNVYLDGLSVGASSGGFNLAAEVFNQNGQGVYGLDVHRAGRYSGVGYLLGASLQLSEEVNGSNGAFPVSRALYAGASWDRFTLMGEYDLVGQSNDTTITYANLTTRIIYGLYGVVEYNYFDGDNDAADSVDEFVRLSVELYPIPFFQLRPSYTNYTRGLLEGSDDFFLQVHFGY